MSRLPAKISSSSSSRCRAVSVQHHDSRSNKILIRKMNNQISGCPGAQYSQYRAFGKMRTMRRVAYPWMQELRRDAWKFLHQEMIEHFRGSEAPQHSLITNGSSGGSTLTGTSYLNPAFRATASSESSSGASGSSSSSTSTSSSSHFYGDNAEEDHARGHQELCPRSVNPPTFLNARDWPKFSSKDMILEEKDRLPALITKHGPDRGIVLKMSDVMPLAFDEEGGHLSHLLKSRLYRIRNDDQWARANTVDPSTMKLGDKDDKNNGLQSKKRISYAGDELCYVSDVRAHVVDKKLYFLRFERHVPFKTMTKIPVPVCLIGVYGCPGQLKGAHIDLNMPTVMCEVVGEEFPKPFLVDCSKLTNTGAATDPESLERMGKNAKESRPFGSPVVEYGRITLRDLLEKGMLEQYNGLVRFSREYDAENGGYGLENTEVVLCYDWGNVPEQPLPADWEDPNFNTRQGRYHLTYSGFWPRQVQRS
ncbi:unnamed protein product [Amoebophrya sp. A120]|nr:unnamed protein product [Amoebophrya sp. A120]|eukprot:GSA120T00025709001.1